jgi:hypothetical protein
MTKVSLTDQIKKEQDALKKTQERINRLKEKEAWRLLRIAEKVGYFEIDASDDAIESAFTNLVESSKNTS